MKIMGTSLTASTTPTGRIKHINGVTSKPKRSLPYYVMHLMIALMDGLTSIPTCGELSGRGGGEARKPVRSGAAPAPYSAISVFGSGFDFVNPNSCDASIQNVIP